MNAPLDAGATHPVATLFGEHGTFVFRTLRYFGVSDDAADDALQDVFATAYRRWSSFEGRAAPRTWLYGISRRVAYRYRRRARSHGDRFVFADVERVERPFDSADARATVAALLDGLDARKREAFVLVEVEGLTAPEAAAALELPLGTVYSRVRAAWQLLRRAGAVEQGVVGTLQGPPMSKARQRAAHRAVIAGCTPLGLAGGASVAGVGGWVIAASLAGAAVVGAGVWAASGPPPESNGPSEASTERVHEKTAPSGGGALAPASSDPAVPPAPPAFAPSPATPARAVGRSHAVPRGSKARQTGKTRNAADALAAEIKLVRAAQAAQLRGDLVAAEKALLEHARLFPRGQLADERREALAGLDSR